MENTSDAKFYVEMVYNVSWSRLVWMIIVCVAGDKRRKARQSWGMQEGEECAMQGKKDPLCTPCTLVPKFSISLFLLKPATQATMMITQVVKRNKRYNIFFQAHLWGY